MHFHPSVYWRWAAGILIRATHCQKARHKSSYKRRCRHLHFNLIVVLQDSAAHIACKALFLGSGLRTFWLFLSIFPFETFLDTLFVPLELLIFFAGGWRLMIQSFVHAGQSTQWHYSQLNRRTCKKWSTLLYCTLFIFLHNVALSASKICACTIVDCRSCTTSNHWYLSQSWFRTKTSQHACASINLLESKPETTSGGKPKAEWTVGCHSGNSDLMKSGRAQGMRCFQIQSRPAIRVHLLGLCVDFWNYRIGFIRPCSTAQNINWLTKMPSGAWPSPLPMTKVERPCRQQFRSKTTSRWSQACTEASFYLQHVKIAHLYSNKDGVWNCLNRSKMVKACCNFKAWLSGSCRCSWEPAFAEVQQLKQFDSLTPRETGSMEAKVSNARKYERATQMHNEMSDSKKKENTI